MKKNVFLLFLLGLLLVFAFYFEEIGKTQKKLREDSENRLFETERLGVLIGVETVGGNHIYYKNGMFYTKKQNYPVSPEELQNFFDVLSGIKIERYLDKNEINEKNITDFIPDPKRKMIFTFEKGKMEFTLGQKLQTDPSFYIQVKSEVDNHIVVAYDDSPLEGIYQQENIHLNTEKFNRMVKMFYMTEEDFEDKAILKGMDLAYLTSNLTSFRIENIRNISFLVKPIDEMTLPGAYPGLSFNREFYHFFLGAMANFKAHSLYPLSNINDVRDKIGTIVLSFGKQSEQKLELFRKHHNRTGFFVTSSKEQMVFEVDQNYVRLFFSNVQDFWLKRVIPSNFADQNKTFEMTLVFDREYRFTIHNQPKFNVLAKNPITQPKNSGFKELLTFLSNEADFVKQHQSHSIANLLSFTFLDSTFHVIFKEGDLIIVDVKRDLDFYFHVGDLSGFKHKKSDYIND